MEKQKRRSLGRNFTDGALWARLFLPGLITLAGCGPYLIVPSSAYQASLSALPASVVADGVTSATVTVLLKDTQGNPLAGIPLSVTSNRGSVDKISVTNNVTDSAGQITVNVSSSQSGTVQLSVAHQLLPSAVTLVGGQILFLSATPWTDYQALLFDRTNPGSNTSTAKSTWVNLASSSLNKGTLSSYGYTSLNGWTGAGSVANPYALLFDGVANYVDFGQGVNTSNSFSFETWIKPSSSSSLGPVILSNGSSSGTTNLGITLKQSKVSAKKLQVSLGSRSYSDEVLADSPVSYWRLGERSGTTALDSAGSNSGTYSGGVTLNQTGAFTGDPNPSPLFDGATGTVDFGNPSNLNFTAGSFTLEGWFNTTESNPIIIVSSGSSDNWVTPGYCLMLYYGSVMGIIDPGGQGGSVAVDTNSTGYMDGTWHHAAFVVDFAGKTAKLYVDGVLPVVSKFGTTCGTLTGTTMDFSACSPNAANGSHVYVGSVAGTDYLNGNISEVAIYNTPLSAARILAHYQARLRTTCVSTSSLTDSVWSFISGVFDSSGPTLKLFVNGVQECSITNPGAIYTGSTQTLKVGADSSGANAWKGSVSEVRTYNSTLSSSGVLTNYNARSSSY